MKLYGIFGAGGFGREVMPMVQAMLEKERSSSDCQLVFIDEKNAGSLINNCLIMSIEDFFSHNATEKFFNIAIANYVARKKIAEMMINNGAKPFRVKAENSIELANNEIDEGGIFCPFTTITSNAKIGKFFHANIYSYVAHDCVIGDYVTFAPNVHCNGNVHIEDYAYIGTGAIIREGTPGKPTIIGKGAMVGMGAVVTKNVMPYEVVVGNPARLLRRNEELKLPS